MIALRLSLHLTGLEPTTPHPTHFTSIAATSWITVAILATLPLYLVVRLRPGGVNGTFCG